MAQANRAIDTYQHIGIASTKNGAGMTEPDVTIYCFPCNMHFRVEQPRTQVTPTTRCYYCGRRFWHTSGHGKGPAKVGVWPENVEAA